MQSEPPAQKRLKVDNVVESDSAAVTQSVSSEAPTPLAGDSENDEGANDNKNSNDNAASDSLKEDAETGGSSGGVRWPWIPLMDPAGRQYYYNALTSKTSWSPSNEAAGTTIAEVSKAPPPTAFSAASAQGAWQRYWAQWQTAQASKVLSRCVPGLTRPPPQSSPPDEEDDQSSGSSRSLAVAMSIFIEHYQSPSAKQLGRSARQQVRPPDAETLGYTQGNEEYNIWYGKHLSDQFDVNGRREEREKATTRCNPFTDAGWTRCDLETELDRPVICIYFARGCCYLGSKCRYYHRLPTAEDDEKLDMLHDIFGRERFAAHRDDMDGVGTFSEECRTLFIGDLKVNRVYPNAEEKSEELIRQQFGLWGPLEDIKVIRNKNIAFIRYKYRVHAEFAKVAMAEQRLMLDRPDDQISVRWAHPGRGNEDKPNEQQAQEWEAANQAMMKRLSNLGYTQEDLECYIRWEINQNEDNERNQDQIKNNAATSIYPNTDHRLQLGGKNQMLPIPLAEATIEQNENSQTDITCPDSEASHGLYRMQEILSRIKEPSNDPDAFTVQV